MTDTAFKIRLQAATLEKVVDLRQAHGLPSGEVVGLWTRLINLADIVERTKSADSLKPK